MAQDHEDNNDDKPSYDWATRTILNTQLNEKGNRNKTGIPSDKSLSQMSQKSITSKSSQPSHSGSHHTTSNNSKAELNKMDIISHSIATELFGNNLLLKNLLILNLLKNSNIYVILFESQLRSSSY